MGSSLAAPVGTQGSASDAFGCLIVPSNDCLHRSSLRILQQRDFHLVRLKTKNHWSEGLSRETELTGQDHRQVNLSKKAAVSVDDMAIVTPTQSPATVGCSALSLNISQYDRVST